MICKTVSDFGFELIVRSRIHDNEQRIEKVRKD